MAVYSRCPIEAKKRLYQDVIVSIILPKMDDESVESTTFLHTPVLVTGLFEQLCTADSDLRHHLTQWLARFGAGQSAVVTKTLAQILAEEARHSSLNSSEIHNLKNIIVEISKWLFSTGTAELHHSANTILLIRVASYLFGREVGSNLPVALCVDFANSLARRPNLALTLSQNQHLEQEFLGFCEHASTSSSSTTVAQIIYNTELLNKMTTGQADGQLQYPRITNELANAIASDEIALRVDATFWAVLFSIPHKHITWIESSNSLAGWLRLAYALDQCIVSLSDAITAHWSSLVSRRILGKSPLLASLLSDADVQVVLHSVARSADRQDIQLEIFSESEVQGAASLSPLNQIMSSIRTGECSLAMEVTNLLSPLLSQYRNRVRCDSASTPQNLFLGIVKNEIDCLVRHNWHGSVYGEDMLSLFRGAREIQWQEMDGEVIRFDETGDPIYVDPKYIKTSQEPKITLQLTE